MHPFIVCTEVVLRFFCRCIDVTRQTCIKRMAVILASSQVLAQGTLLYSGTNMTECWQNGCGLNRENTITGTLTNSVAYPQNFIVFGYITPANVLSYDLIDMATQTATNKGTLARSGFLNTNESSVNRASFAFILNSGASNNGNASVIAGHKGTNHISVWFLSSASKRYVNATFGSDTNNGTSPGTARAFIINA